MVTGNLITKGYLKSGMMRDYVEPKKPRHSIVIEGKEMDLSRIDGTRMMCCPINNTFKILGKKFTILILRNMMAYKQTRFSEFLDTIEKINAKTLSKRLREMEEEGLIEKKIIQKSPIRVENHLTQKGWELKSIITAMAEFSMNQCANKIFKDKKPRMFEDIKGDHPIMIFK